MNHNTNKKKNSSKQVSGSNERHQNSGNIYSEWAKRGNIGFYFYRGLYEGLEEKLLSQDEDLEKEILTRSRYLLENRKVDTLKAESWIDRSLKDISHFCLVTTYPGLLIGSGYCHGIKSEGDFKLGFYFDYTTGMPVIPGSTIKGVLRSAFGASHNKNERFRQEKQKYILEKLIGLADQQRGNIEEIKNHGYTSRFVELLEKDIFEGIGSDGKVKPLAERDVFFDAYPVAGDKGTSENLFYDDYITPHIEDKIDIKKGAYEIDENSALKNPIPIRFLKVAPGIRYKFSFILHDSVILTGPNQELKITKKMKVLLFKEIILDFGLGAKTNVGYGAFAGS